MRQSPRQPVSQTPTSFPYAPQKFAYKWLLETEKWSETDHQVSPNRNNIFRSWMGGVTYDLDA